jgi:hypothetical protein
VTTSQNVYDTSDAPGSFFTIADKNDDVRVCAPHRDHATRARRRHCFLRSKAVAELHVIVTRSRGNYGNKRRGISVAQTACVVHPLKRQTP